LPLVLTNAPSTLTVQAAAGGNTASGTASFGGMDVTAAGEVSVSRPGSGTPYTPGAHTS